jgi:tetratricopeptide (TPR) repeat protein
MSERDLFIAALQQQDPAERRAFLDGACAGRPELRRQVEHLLQLHEGAGSFLEMPAAASVATGAFPGPAGPAFPPELPGALVGPYQLLERIGEGGMGTVWLAQQHQPVRRLVAVKLIKAGMDSAQVIARFEAERQALALMDHPHIARVLDGGTTASGRPYFVMDLVRGAPITRYCDEHRLTPRQRLELFVPVCQAVQHAHQKGVIHRDLKPSNVLVAEQDGRPVPKVIDFGVAKAAGHSLTERTLVTGFGVLVGTPEYMSPEQAEVNPLDIDTRSDIYSLGVLLYELLTGSPPFTRKELGEAGLLEMLRVIREQEPTRPSARLSTAEGLPTLAANRGTEPAKLTRQVRGELDWIVLKALEKDRARRYETANAFALDVQRYLADEPVLACPPSAGYRFRKFARRNKRGLVMALLIGVALLALGSFGLMARDRAAQRGREADEVNQFLQRAEALYADNKLPEAVAEVQQARGVLEAGSGDANLARRVRQWLTDLDMAAKLEECRLQNLGKRNHPRMIAGYARLFRDYGIDVETLPTEEAAARVAASAIKLDLALALRTWATILRWDSRKQDRAPWQRLVALSRAADPDPWYLRFIEAVEARDVRTLRELAKGTDLARVRARFLAHLGGDLTAAGLAEAAVAFLRKAREQHPGDYSINSTLASALSRLKPPPWDEVIAFQRAALAIRPRSAVDHNSLGAALLHKDRIDEAIDCFRKAIELDPRNALTYSNLAGALFHQKKARAALAAAEKAIELDPTDAGAHGNRGAVLGVLLHEHDRAIDALGKAIKLKPNSSVFWSSLGQALYAQKKLPEANAAFRKAIELNPKFAPKYHSLGVGLYDQNKLDEAIGCFRKAIELDPSHLMSHLALGSIFFHFRPNYGEAAFYFRKVTELDPKNAMAHAKLAYSLEKLGQLDLAIGFYLKVTQLDPKSARAHTSLAIALESKGRVDEAIGLYRKAVKLNPKYVIARFNLGTALARQRKLNEAIAVYRKVIEIDEKFIGAHINLGVILCDELREHAKAEACFRKALELNPKHAHVHFNLGVALDGRGKLDDAIAYFRKAIELDPTIAKAHKHLGAGLERQKKFAEALDAYRKASKLSPKSAPVHFKLGALLRIQRKVSEAVTALCRAIEIDPKHLDAHLELGTLLRDDLRDYQNAAAYLRKAIKLDPQSALAHHKLGAVLRAQGKLPEAIASYRRAIGIDATLVRAYIGLGALLCDELRDYRNAEAWFRKALELDPKSVAAHSNLGVALKGQGKSEEAIAQFRKAIELAPKATLPRINLGNLLLDLGRLDEAIAAFRGAVRVEPQNAYARNLLASALNRRAWTLVTDRDPRKRDPGRAVELAREAVGLTPKVAEQWSTLGVAHYRAGNWTESVGALQKSMDLGMRGDGLGGFFLAMAHWRLGNKGQARTWYDRALAWVEGSQPPRAEAAQLLGVEKKKD